MLDPETREAIQEAVEQALHPGMPDPRAYLRVTVTDPTTGKHYKGMLYLLVSEEPFPEKEANHE